MDRSEILELVKNNVTNKNTITKKIQGVCAQIRKTIKIKKINN